MASMEKHLFNLKFASKELERCSKKSDKEEKAEKLKLKKAIEKGNHEVRSLLSWLERSLTGVLGCQDTRGERHQTEEPVPQLPEDVCQGGCHRQQGPVCRHN